MALVHLRGWDASAFAESPWYFPLSDLLARFVGRPSFPGPAELDRLLAESAERAGLTPLRVAHCPPKKKLRRKRRTEIDLDALYDVRIVEHGEVPTRTDDWHDFFNVLAFAAFPRAKRALHARQCAVLRARLSPGQTRLPGVRTREQDALTMLDEGGALVACTASAHEALVAEGQELGQALRDAVDAGAARIVPFGHALFEHLVERLPCPLAVPTLIRVDYPCAPVPRLRDELDRALAGQLEDRARFVAPHRIKGLELG